MGEAGSPSRLKACSHCGGTAGVGSESVVVRRRACGFCACRSHFGEFRIVALVLSPHQLPINRPKISRFTGTFSMLK